ncbi:DUF922 domain-containing protein [Mucilaginibacter sp. UR6-11]|uniref:DUF922 domain-containing protein n=1 Tax=Mucilaginibacter sp. UR6-11 TaxID=1435644 RepID=UPI001E2F738A|nr:DUF922 domain-containing protein [Mucilaginibacter sp. UR6-11]MCC8424360.1 DUF922 domain-containing protein [Mucilaginibacter sp. UR6-11]
MRLLKPLLSLSLLLCCLSAANAQQIKWDKNRPLTWDDFKGPVDMNSPHDAVTSCQVAYNYHCRHIDSVYVVTVAINSWFDCQASWAVKRMENEDILKHEQVHFNIHELYMRRLAAAFKAARFTADYRREVRWIFDDVMREARAAQTKYDEQTEHSRDAKLQAYWDSYVQTQLDHTSPDY